ncbi:hypothetical protein FRC08_018072, partial [Ceratobasidium sp. 394]
MYAEPILDQNISSDIAVWNFRKPAVSVCDELQHPTASGFFNGTIVPRRGVKTVIPLDTAHLPLISVLLDNEYIIAQT